VTFVNRLLSSDRHYRRFFIASLFVFAACAAIMRTAAFAKNPDVGYFGITFDLCITIPFIYYLLVIRRGHVRPLSIVPVFIVCLMVARAIVPASQHEFLRQLALLHVPMEAAVILAVAFRYRAAKATFRDDDDFVQRIETVCRSIFGDNRASHIVAGELTACYLGTFGWRMQPPRERGIASTTFHQRIGWGSVVACALLLIAVEGVAVHLLVQRWSAPVAWLITAMDVWGAIWLLGDYQAFRLRPLVVTNDTIELRFGFRWSAMIPRDLIAAIEPLSGNEAERLRRSRRYLRLSLLDEPSYAIRLRKPVRIDGVAGLRRIVTCIGIGPDDTSIISAMM
jgi:hypothetical protein